MSRPLRIEYPEAWYHVMNRGRRFEDIFLAEDDYQQFIDLLIESSEMWNVNISAYCLMPNHYHMLVHTPEANLSRFMRHVSHVYTRRFNAVHHYNGQLFRGRYKSILVSADVYLKQIVRYIHRNPIRAGITDNLRGYKWSSHRGYISEAKKWEWLYKDFIFKMFSDNKIKAKQVYRKFVRESDSEEIESIFSKLRLPVVIGTEHFKIWVKHTFYKQGRHQQVPDILNLAPEASEIISVVCNYYQIEEAHLFKSRRGFFNEPRNVAIYLIRLLRKDNLLSIAETFQMSGYSSVSSAIDRMKKEMKAQKKIRELIVQMKVEILKSQTNT